MPKFDDGVSDINGVDNPLVSGLNAERGEVGNCEMEVEADQSCLVSSYSDQVTSCAGADKGSYR